jgi:succinate dehydrogenase/fumarate reductase flavoprotein subunit
MTHPLFETDVLIVGGGGAGFRAAIGAREKGAAAILLSKGPLGRCGATPMAGADFTLDGNSLHALGFNGDPNDTKEKVFSDIVHQGIYLNNQKLVEQYVHAAPDRLQELVDWGTKITFSEERAIFTSGIEIMDALVRQARSVGVGLLEDTMLIDLVTQDGRVTGALGLDIQSGEFIHFQTKAVVMATGGWHKAFWPNTGMRDLSGEGIAMASRAGADIGNMEFITYCCNVLYEPPMWRGSIATYVMSLLCGGQLTNSKGEDFLAKYDPYTVQCATGTEWNKSFISFATMEEVRGGKGSPNGGVYYGKGDVPWDQFEGLAMMILPKWKYKALDLTELGRKMKNNETVEVGPAVEYFDGGIVVDEQFKTAVAGLYAAGECTLGPFGANRVFSAITEMLVHGADAGRNAGEYAKGVRVSDPRAPALESLRDAASTPLSANEGLRPAEVRRRVQEMAHKHLGPIRNQQELEAFIGFLDRVKTDELPNLATTSKSPAYNKEWIDAIELQNMVQLLETAAKAALLRTESRGVHYREDYPQTDNDNWLQESIAKLVAGELEISKRPCAYTSLTPQSGVTP